MSTHTKIYYHITFATKNHNLVLDADNSKQLYKYLWGIIKNKKCELYRINGVRDHIHLLISLHPSISLSDFMRTIKTYSTKWIKNKKIFSHFHNWQDGYGAFTISHLEKDNVIEYIKNQEEHHNKITFEEELKILLNKHDVSYDEKYFP